MVNCVGCCDDFETVGNSAVWDTEGKLLGQLPSNEEGLLFFDAELMKVHSLNQ
ncbi:MAG: nitrilase-related carbon-nitrogen hydrolase [Saprospiraceae bacterium]